MCHLDQERERAASCVYLPVSARCELRLCYIAENVRDNHMQFLCEGRINNGDAHSNICQFLQAACTLTSDGNNPHQALVCNNCGTYKVLGFPTGAKGDQQVLWLTESTYLPSKNVLIAVIISHGGENRGIGGE